MKCEIDISYSPYQDTFIVECRIIDDGDVVVVFGDVELRMGYLQFSKFYEAIKAWHEDGEHPEGEISKYE